MPRQQDGEHARARAVSDVKRLPHRANVLSQTCRRRPDDAHRHARCHGIRAEEPASRYGHALAADNRLRVPAAVDQLGAKAPGDATEYFESHCKRLDHRASRAI